LGVRALFYRHYMPAGFAPDCDAYYRRLAVVLTT
jgi:hypothetical protein